MPEWPGPGYARLTRTALSELNDRQHTGERTCDTVAIRRPAGIEVWSNQGLDALRHPAPDERAAIVAALGLTGGRPASDRRVTDRRALRRRHPRTTGRRARFGPTQAGGHHDPGQRVGGGPRLSHMSSSERSRTPAGPYPVCP
ncbi:hypothetical protein GCM10018785_60510 [Streptomyces longispororuber]|uniref:Uncharacterized protein n=1 Tax=Streptomyces longispororuber TaxID=68230 RepID=A0A919DU21_9ACTN|nr:hypothetical protein GCM10018785_60510 [Streptomyces longispororuber]